MLLQEVWGAATTELVVVGFVLVVCAMGWMFISGFIDEWGPTIGLIVALGVGTVLPTLYLLFVIQGY